ncbi:MAG: acetyltransferase [Pseudomonadota bacterium]|nr:acetyltransferase [Pseudomonadota bacterium]
MSQTFTKTPLLLIGGGGHCASVIDVIESSRSYEVAGIVEAPGNTQNEFMGYPILGTDEDLESLITQIPNCVITVGQLKCSTTRKKLFKKVKGLGGQLPVIISTRARVASHAKIADGTIVMHYALVNNLAQVSENCIVNSYALIEHGANIGSHCHIATRATVNGDCQIGGSCFIGSNATLIQGVSVAAESVIGAGSLVTKSILEKGTYIGSPAKKRIVE